MIEVTATLPGRSVFLAGETIVCEINFTNLIHTRKNGSPAKSLPAKLAWASAQIHCQCSVSEARVCLPKAALLTSSEVTTTGSETSFIPSKGERGSTVLSTKPTILFCDLNLQPGESHIYKYRETIPKEAAPTYRGTAVKYSYKITIGTQRFDCPTKLLRVPFRVLVVPGVNDLSVYGEGDEMKPNNPFQQQLRKEFSLLEVALEILQTITCRKGPSTYNITNCGGKVAKICLFKQAYRIGEDIVGTCDFTDGTVPCVQFSVTLQCEETVTEECRKKPAQGVTVTSFSKHEEFCLHTARTHVSLPIPLTATPGFLTDLVCLRWRLHFEFVTSKTPMPTLAEPASDSESASWQGPSQLDVETMVWDLPIKVFATNPMYATSVSLLRTETACQL